MARTVKFKNDIQRQTYQGFLSYLGLYIPAYRMPANKFYSQFNNAVKLYINKSSDFDDIDSILDIDDVGLLTRILLSIENRFAYVKRDDKKTEGLKYYIGYLKSRKSTNSPTQHKKYDIKDVVEEYEEGSLLDCHGSKYERSRKARNECLEYYGYRCRVCGFDFEKQYGKIGREFIEVHHRTEVSSYGGTNHKVHPIEDLIPVCSNCHSMLHRTRPAMSIADLSSLVKNSKDSCE
jgi:5-methylcytosine-specific restriction protein A